MRGDSFLYDLAGCRDIPSSSVELAERVAQAAEAAGMHIAFQNHDDFPQQQWKDAHGSSCLALIVPLQESHIAVHTWPATGEVWIDFCTCGDSDLAADAAWYLAHSFRPNAIVRFRHFSRGMGVDLDAN